MTHDVVLAHDYATQRGGAERVALLLARAFPAAPMHTTLYDPDGTFPEFSDLDLRTSRLDRVAVLRRHHRLALPLLPAAVDAQPVTGDVLVASSTGWAHGFRGARSTVVYCHAPARWLYQRDNYLGAHAAGGRLGDRARRSATRLGLRVLSGRLRRWDGAAAERADVYLANSSVTQRAVREAYGIDAEVLPPPPAMPVDGPEQPVDPGQGTLDPGFLLCVARLLPYKNVDVVVEAAGRLGRELVVVGGGPDRGRLEQLARRSGARVRFLGRVDDAELRWLYRRAALLVAASFEDYGLTPLEAGSFARPVVVLRAGGYLDTVCEGVNGLFFDEVTADAVADALERALAFTWDPAAITAHVAQFSEERFCARIRQVVAQQLERLGSARAEEVAA